MGTPELLDPAMIAADRAVAIAERLKAERLRAGYSQRDLARQVGVTRETMRCWENAQRSPNAERLVALHELGLDVMLILTGERRPEAAALIS